MLDTVANEIGVDYHIIECHSCVLCLLLNINSDSCGTKIRAVPIRSFPVVSLALWASPRGDASLRKERIDSEDPTNNSRFITRLYSPISIRRKKGI